jgi:endo-1,4-beta-xylanase
VRRLLTGAIVLAGCARGGAAGRPIAVAPEPPTLARLAAARRFEIGAAVQAAALLGDSSYASAAARHFNLLTTENALKFGPLRPSRDRYEFAEADAIVAFAEAHGQRVRGHTLVWKRQLPDWLTAGSFTREELVGILREHIQTVVGRYRGRIAMWDVVNEALRDSIVPGGDVLRETIWLRGIGPDYLALAFRFAHEADPGALLFYNDFKAEDMGPKSDAVYRLVWQLRRDGVPVHGVGLQMHVGIEAPPDTAALGSNLRRLAALGLQVQITEMDVRMGSGNGTEAERLAAQAVVYQGVLATCLSVPACTALVTWGVSDRYTWLHPDTPLPLDATYRPKPAYRAMIDALR